MRVLFLGPADSPLIGYLQESDEVAVTDEPLTVELLDGIAPEWTVSYGYRHILRGEVLRRIEGRAINLHISYLPWNRGADPNLWSFIDGTPKGVSIHFIDAGVDTGDLIAQRIVEPQENDTLASSYQRLHEQIQALFREVWPAARQGHAQRRRQPYGGSQHRVGDKARVEHRLTAGWDTPVASLI